MLGSGGPRHGKMRKPIDTRASVSVAPTAIKDSVLVEVGALREMLNPGLLEEPDGEALATTGAQHVARTLAVTRVSRIGKGSEFVIP